MQIILYYIFFFIKIEKLFKFKVNNVKIIMWNEIDTDKEEILKDKGIDITDLSICINNNIYCNVCNYCSISPTSPTRIKEHLKTEKHKTNKIKKDYEEQLKEKDKEIEQFQEQYDELLRNQDEHITNLREEYDQEYEIKLKEKDEYIQKLENELKEKDELKTEMVEKDIIIKNKSIELERKNEIVNEHKIINDKNNKLIKELYIKINLLEYSKKFSSKKYSFA